MELAVPKSPLLVLQAPASVKPAGGFLWGQSGWERIGQSLITFCWLFGQGGAGDLAGDTDPWRSGCCSSVGLLQKKRPWWWWLLPEAPVLCLRPGGSMRCAGPSVGPPAQAVPPPAAPLWTPPGTDPSGQPLAALPPSQHRGAPLYPEAPPVASGDPQHLLDPFSIPSFPLPGGRGSFKRRPGPGSAAARPGRPRGAAAPLRAERGAAAAVRGRGVRAEGGGGCRERPRRLLRRRGGKNHPP